MGFILAGDLADERCEVGGLTAQLSHLANVLELSITDHAGIAATYDRRIHLAIRKAAPKRPANKDYFSFLSTLDSDAKAAVTRDFESRVGTLEKKKAKGEEEKAKKANGGQRIGGWKKK